MSCPHAMGGRGAGVSGAKRLGIIVLMATFLCSGATPPVHAQKHAVAQQPRFHAAVDMVIVNVAVFDRSGAPVVELEKTDFAIFDDGEEQEIAVFLTPRASPLAIVLALDFSESVRPMAPRAREAAATFLHSLSRDDCAYVLPFQSSVARGRWIPGADPEIGRLLRMIPFEGGTALYDAIEIGLDKLQAVDKLEGVDARSSDQESIHPPVGQESIRPLVANPAAATTVGVCGGAVPGNESEPGSDRRRALVVLTDGNDQNSVAEYSDILSRAQTAGVPIFPVAIGGAADHFWGGSNVGRILSNKRHSVQLEELARSSGGTMIRSNRSEGLQAAYAEVLNALRASYVVGYYLPATAAQSAGEVAPWRDVQSAGEEARWHDAEPVGEGDRWHDIEVTVSRSGVRVQARPGYIARSPAPRLVPTR